MTFEGESEWKILLATDGSNFSEAAIDACREIIAAPENAHFKIISAVAYPMMPAADPFVGGSADCYDRVEKAGYSLAQEYVAQAARQLRALFSDIPLDVVTEVHDGAPQQVIIEQAESWGADLIVIGSHGNGFWSRALLGSISSAIVHHAPCSVLVVRARHD